MDFLQPVAIVVALTIVLSLAVFLGQQADKLLKARIDDAEYNLIKQVVMDAVESAEQWLESESGNAKRKYVLQQVAAFANQRGIKIDSQQLGTLIESAVYNVKQISAAYNRIDSGDISRGS